VLFMPRQAADQASAVPMFSPFPNNGWVPDRPTGDDFIRSAGFCRPRHVGPETSLCAQWRRPPADYRVADLTNPILKPWAIEKDEEGQ
jgi:hypothetical protein